MLGISKRFGDLQVLRDVDLEVGSGEIHAVVGENGAGKTTLVKILAGLEVADGGSISVNGVELPAGDARRARKAGVGMVPQHCEVAPGLSVLENLALGDEPSRFGLLDRGAVRRRGEEAGERLGFRFSWDDPAETLGMAARQRLELVRLLARDASVLVLDEPTTVLTSQEVEVLFAALRPLAAEGRTLLFITHKLDEVRALASSITVLRGGQVAGRLRANRVDNADIARLMIGEVSAAPTVEARRSSQPPRLSLKHVSSPHWRRGDVALRAVTMEVRGGEIVGVAGIEGNGQQELVDVIAGLHRPSEGDIDIDGEAVGHLGIRDRKARGLSVIPADRVHEGANLLAPIWETATANLAATAGATRAGVLPRRELRRRGAGVAARVGVRTPPHLPTASLSGGNLQRLIVGRELDTDPLVVVCAHPTRGVDVRGTAFIHQRLIDVRAAGRAVLILSADLGELSACCDRIYVLTDGTVAGEFVPGELDSAQIGLLMTGSKAGTGVEVVA